MIDYLTTAPEPHDAGLEELISSMCEGSLDAAGALQLERLVTGSREAMRYYLEYVHLHGTLGWDREVAPSEPSQPVVSRPETVAEGQSQTTIFGKVTWYR